MNHCTDPNPTTMTQDNTVTPSLPSEPSDRRVHTPLPRLAGPNQSPVFRSQIPIRTPINAQNPHARARAHNIQAYRAIEAHIRSVFASHHPRLDPAASTLAAARVARTLAARQAVSRNIDAAFSVYDRRVQTDLRDFHVLCSALVRQEQQEKEQWRLMCAKVIKERDAARALLEGKREDGATSPATAPALKRERDEASENLAPRSPSTTDESRPMRPLPGSRSPSPSSPTGSQYYGSERSTPPPNSADSDTPRTPSRNRSAPPLMTTFRLSPSPPTAKGADEPPLKRRRSCDSSGTAPPPSGGASPPPDWSPPRRALPPLACGNPTSAPSLPGEFSHVDVMYVPTNGVLVCRPCTIAVSKMSEPARARAEPKAFPMSASWDELREHCVRVHPDECMLIARLHPAEIFELRRRHSM